MEQIIKLKNNQLTIAVSTLGAELKNIQTADGTEHLHQPDEFWQDQAPVLFPFCGTPADGTIKVNGKVFPMDSHGFVKTCYFNILEQSTDAVTLSLSSSRDTKQFYPFDFSLELMYSLQGNSLKIQHKVMNHSEDTIYFSIGYHEGYQCKKGLSNYEIHFEKQESNLPFIFETKNVPDSFLKTENGHSVLALSDDLFQNAITVVYEDLNSEYVVLKEKSTKNDIRISFPGFDRLLIWSCPGASFVCIEPWCGMAEYESSMDISLVPGIHFLRHGDCFQGTHTISF